MHRILSRCLVVALAAGLGASTAQAQFETSYHDNGDHTATLTLTFHNDTQNKTFKDLHVLPLHGSLKLPQGNPSLPSGWSQAGTTSSKGLHLQTDGAGIGPDGDFQATYTFHYSGTFIKFLKSLQGTLEVGTTDGGDQIVWEGEQKNVCHTEGGDTWPSHFAGWRNPETAAVAVADTTTLRLETSVFGGHAFKLYAATALSTTPDGPDNPLGIGLDLSHPLPASWNLVFTPPLGRPALFTEVPDDLDQAIVSVAVPADDALAGQRFYLVAALDLDGDGRPDVATPPLDITLQPAGTTAGGIVELDDLPF